MWSNPYYRLLKIGDDYLTMLNAPQIRIHKIHIYDRLCIVSPNIYIGFGKFRTSFELFNMDMIFRFCWCGKGHLSTLVQLQINFRKYNTYCRSSRCGFRTRHNGSLTTRDCLVLETLDFLIRIWLALSFQQIESLSVVHSVFLWEQIYIYITIYLCTYMSILYTQNISWVRVTLFRDSPELGVFSV